MVGRPGIGRELFDDGGRKVGRIAAFGNRHNADPPGLFQAGVNPFLAGATFGKGTAHDPRFVIGTYRWRHGVIAAVTGPGVFLG